MDELVPREGWGDFCERFTHQHHGWLVTLEHCLAPADAVDAGARCSTVPLSEFRGIQVVDRPSGQEFCITIADQSGHEQGATVRRPVRLFFEKTPDGSHSGLRLEARNGEALTVRFRTPTRPEILDGLTPQVAQRT
jgi:hypothetical protein